MKLRALALSVLFAAGCSSPKVITEVVPTPTPTPKASKPPKKKRPAVHTPKPRLLGDVWHRLAQCESGGNWSYQGPRYSGGLQFTYATWRMAGGTKYAPTAGEATPAQQIAVAKSWLAKTSWAQWPTCSRLIGVR